MDRRAFVGAVAGGLLGAPLAALAQPVRRVARVGWLSLTAPAGNSDVIGGFREGLQQLGYTEGKNISIEYRFAAGRSERLATLAVELVSLHVDVIVVPGSQPATAAKHATTTIPIVMLGVGDPVGVGYIVSLAKPGGNITGVSSAHGDISVKWLELLREVVPKASRFGYLDDLDSPVSQIYLRNILVAGRTLGVSVQAYSVTKPDDVAPQLTAMIQARVQGILVGSNPVPRVRQKEIVEFAARSRLPAIYAGRDYVDAGGLMSYNPNRPDMGRQSARYVDKILKGAKPADLPVEEPTKIELVINMKAAKALGLTIPQSLLLRADQVIQ
jgi:putative ABC transport system substrate-binding protein